MTFRRTTTLIALAAGVVAVPAAAQADTLETPVAGADNLAAGGGWHAWSAARPDGRFRLQLRRPDGTVLTPDIPPFGAPVDPAIGTRGGADGINTPASRRISAVYSRCAGTSALAGCDVHALNLTTLEEARVPALATRTYSETVPSLNGGRWSFVRRGGGPRKGTYHYSDRSGELLRLSPTIARDTATSQSRMAFTYDSSRGFGIQVRRSSGEGTALVPAAGLEREPLSPQITRYRVGWLIAGPDATHVFQTTRFAGSGGPYGATVQEAPRTLPAPTSSAAGNASALFDRYIAPDGIRRIDPAIR
ncbi:MAG: hypothetical protein JWO90_2372 [Solirubrobacterales bacterium]|nr:hypothetical protein [Solirubrobacterales bacterium]